MPAPLTVRPATDADLVTLEPVYVAAFPPAEREQWAVLAARHASGAWTVLAAATDGVTVGLAVLAPLPTLHAALLLYLVVAAEHRNAGVGGELFETAAAHAAASGAPAGLVIEVERVADAADPADAALRGRRLRFYARHGAHPLAGVTGYGMPDMRTGELLPLHLLWRSAARVAADVDPAELVAAVHHAGYGLEPADPRTAAVLTTLAQRG